MEFSQAAWSTPMRVALGAAIATVVIAAAILATLPTIRETPADRAENVILVTPIRAPVEIQRSGHGYRPLSEEIKVHPGDRVRTGVGAYASITYFDGSQTMIDPDTVVVVREVEGRPGIYVLRP
jgi:hypothetical protein